MNSDEFRRLGHLLIDWIADYRAKVEELPVMSRAKPGDVRRELPAAPPVEPEAFDDVMRDLERVIVPRLTHWQHPNFFAYFPSNSEWSSVLGDYLSTGLGVLGLSWQSSPALTELEEVVVGWVRQMVDLSDAWSGVIQDTASSSTLIALVCARERAAWMHVDAAMAGSAMILPECRWMWKGIESADSLVFNPHKWLGAAFDCSLYFVRDVDHLVRVMSTSPSYLRTGSDHEVNNLRDWGVALGRRFRALKLWCLIREQGLSGLQARLRRDIDNARWLESQVKVASHWRVLAPVVLQTVCVRHEPPGLEGDALDVHTRAWVDRINASGAAYLTPAVLDGRWMARVSVGGLRTERRHVEALWSLMRRETKSESVRPPKGTNASKTELS